MLGQDDVAHVLLRAFNRGQLHKHVAAITIVVEHGFYTAQLPDDSVEPDVQVLELLVRARSVLVVFAIGATGASRLILVHSGFPFLMRLHRESVVCKKAIFRPCAFHTPW